MDRELQEDGYWDGVAGELPNYLYLASDDYMSGYDMGVEEREEKIKEYAL